MSILICDWTTAPPDDWDDYVLSNPDAGVFHLAEAVRIGHEAFGLNTYYLTARDIDGRLVGIAPLVEQVLLPWTRTLVSLPFCTYGGLVATEAAIPAILGCAKSIAELRGATQVIFRGTRDWPSMPCAARHDKVSMVLSLPGCTEELAKALGSKLRSQIRRSERVRPEICHGGPELLGDFYAVFRNVMRDLGTPVYPRSFFEVVLRLMRGRATVFVSYVAGRPVSGAIVVRWREALEVPWAATLHEFNPVSINMRLYWELLQFALSHGCRVFDFGRCTPGTGTFKFKSQWGAIPKQLHWHVWRLADPRHAESDRTRTSIIDGVMGCWSRLPRPLANSLGPIISPHLPW